MQPRSTFTKSRMVSTSLSKSRQMVRNRSYFYSAFAWFAMQSAVLARAFPSVHLGGLGVTYNDHIRLIGKCVVDFLFVLINFFR